MVPEGFLFSLRLAKNAKKTCLPDRLDHRTGNDDHLFKRDRGSERNIGGGREETIDVGNVEKPLLIERFLMGSP